VTSVTVIDSKFFHRSSLCDNVWIDFKSMHSFFVEIMLSQILFLLGWAKLKLFSQSLTQKKIGVNIKFIQNEFPNIDCEKLMSLCYSLFTVIS
jgi:hypothetical protein